MINNRMSQGTKWNVINSGFSDITYIIFIDISGNLDTYSPSIFEGSISNGFNWFIYFLFNYYKSKTALFGKFKEWELLH